MSVAPTHGARILVVDDFSTMRRIITALLSEYGYDDTTEAADGRTALTELGRERYDLVIVDRDMPDMSGIELVKAIRANARLRSAPVLLVTAEAQPERIREAVQSGVDGYIVKPFTAQTLKDKLDRIFTRARCAA